MATKPRLPYQDTKVAVGLSQDDIRKLLRRYGIKQVQFTESLEGEGGPVLVRFDYAHQTPAGEEIELTVRIQAPVGCNERQRWRALYYWLKAQLDATAFGISSPTQIFLPFLEVQDQTGQQATVYDVFEPRLNRLQSGPLANVLAIPARTGE